MGDPKDLLEEQKTPYDMNGPNVRAGMLLMDEDLVAEKVVHWSGFGFKCKQCGVPAVLHFMKYCGNCGAAVNVQSRTVDNYLQRQQEGY